MAPVTTELKVLVKVAGDAGLDRLSRSLINIGKQSNASSIDLGKVSQELKRVQQGSSKSISSLRNYRNAWRDIAEQVEIGSKTFKQATAEANKLDAQLQKAQGRRTGRSSALGRGVQVAGTVAAAGVFGGPEGALGAGIGAVFGGPAGAAVGGAIGAQVGQLRQAASGTAAYAASLEKLRTALFGVTTSQEEYLEALSLIEKSTTDFAIPQEIVTKQFTQLQASVQGAGGSIEDTKVAFNGIVAAVRATGGSLADVDAALTATAQVFSKGKVSAEELRQQIGERLPGAFTLFAQSIGKTPQELDKALEKGEVSLQDFQTFTEALFKRYGQTAQIIADGPAGAGDRLNVALSNMNESVGRLLAPIGASFQDTFTEIIKLIDEAARRLNNFLGIGVEGLDKKVKDLAVQLSKVETELSETPKPQGVFAERDEQGNLKILTRFAALESKQKQLRSQLLSAQDQLNIAIEESERSSISQQTRGAGLPGIVPTAPKGGGGSAERTRERAIQKAIELEEKLRRAIRDTALESNRVGETAREAIENQYTQALQKAIDKEDDLRGVIKELEGQSGTTFPNLTSLVGQLASALEEAASKERDFELFNLRLDELGIKLKDFQNLSEQAFAVGASDAGLAFNVGTDVFERQKKAIDELLKKYPELGQAASSAAELMTFGFRDVIAGAKSAQEVFSNFLNSIADTLLKAAQEMIAQFISIGIARMFAFGSSGFNLGGNFGGFGGGSSSALGGLNFTDLGGFKLASGGVFAKNKIVPFANGGIVKKPTIFPFANGIGLMGEAGPEAIMPLRRGANGRLGVEASGGGTNIVVNVNAQGTSVQGDEGKGRQLGSAISSAVRAELIKQQRPGGLLGR